MTDSKDIERFWLTEDNKAERYPEVIAAIKSWISNGVQIEVRKKRETRQQLQNRLAKRWNKQLADHQGMTLDEMWGALKWDHLLPLKLADESEYEDAVYEYSLVNGAVESILASGQLGDSDRELRIFAAERIVRSRNVGVQIFAQWLTHIQRAAAEQGCVLTSRQDELDYAIAEERKVA